MGTVKKTDLKAAAISFARDYDHDADHYLHVTKLALGLFDQLSSCHGMGMRERRLLEAAAILHDIGWIKGRKGHHKSSLEIILRARELPLDGEQRLITALVARYHRKALPQRSHKYFSSLGPSDRLMVCALAAFLRLADGLDRNHRSSVKSITCSITPEEVVIGVSPRKALAGDLRTGQEKSDLLRKIVRRKVRIERNL